MSDGNSPSGSSTEPRPAESRPSADVGVALVAALLAGSGLAYAHETAPPARRVFAFDGAMSASLPGGWSGHEEEGRFVAQLPGLEGISPTVVVEPLEVPSDPEQAALFHDLELARMQESRASRGVGFRVLHVEERASVEGSGGETWVWFAIVRDPPGTQAGDAVLPVIVHGVDVLVTTAAGRAFHVGAFEPLHGSDGDEGSLRAIVEGISFAE